MPLRLNRNSKIDEVRRRMERLSAEMGPQLLASGVDPSSASLSLCQALDFNSDNVLDMLDVTAFEDQRGSLSPDPYDINNDGDVNINDVVYFYDKLDAFNNRYQDLQDQDSGGDDGGNGGGGGDTEPDFDPSLVTVPDDTCSVSRSNVGEGEALGLAAAVSNDNPQTANVTVQWVDSGTVLASASGTVGGDSINSFNTSVSHSTLTNRFGSDVTLSNIDAVVSQASEA